jgi:hypothetical protein
MLEHEIVWHTKVLDSSLINKLGYTADSLVVEFCNGSVYKYKGAQSLLYDIMQASSAGSYLSSNVIARKDLYEVVRLS